MTDTLDRYEAAQQQADEIITSATDLELLIAVKTGVQWDTDGEMTPSRNVALCRITTELEKRYPLFEDASDDWVNDLDDGRTYREFTLDWFAARQAELAL